MASQEIVLNNRYKLIAQQASGGMAVVYKAQDLQLRRTVAVKVLRPSLTGDPAFLERFKVEAVHVANLSHPNIVTVHDFQQDGSTYYIVMEWIEGQDLKKIIRTAGPIPVERMLKLVLQICAGIGYAHRAGLVHADVKPQNILVTGEDVVKVTDFGIAQALASTQRQEKQSVVWGSPHYFAPEQAQGELPTPASDVYSLGIVMFEMLTGKLPFTGTDQQELALAHIRDAVPHATDYNPRVPYNLDKIIYKVMSKNPNDRYANGDALGRILQSYKQQGTENTVDQAALRDVPPPNPAVPPANARPAAAGFTPAAQTFNQAQRGGTSGSRPAQPVNQSGNTPPPVQPAQPTNPAQRPQQPQNQQPQQPQAQQPQNQPNNAFAQGNSQQYSGLYSVGNPNNPSVQPRQGGSSSPGSGGQRPATGNPQPVYSSGQPAPYTPSVPYAAAPDAQRAPGAPSYQLEQRPTAFNSVTVILGIIAALLILGLVPLWLAVLSR